MNIIWIEKELKKLNQMPPWGRKQNDDWDCLSNFVYEQPGYEEFIQKLTSINGSREFDNYTTHRWYNVLSASGIEQIFCSNPSVIAQQNARHKLIDFSINGINFDHKTSVFPKGFSMSYEEAKENREVLIRWLYAAQSQQGRHHTANRLFIILHNKDGQHWKLRSELSLLQPLINNYVQQFNSNNLCCIELMPNQKTYADIIWFEQ